MTSSPSARENLMPARKDPSGEQHDCWKKTKKFEQSLQVRLFLMPADKQQQRRLTKLELLNEKKKQFFFSVDHEGYN